MTREEIIHGLLLLRNTVESDEDFEIFDSSIKALKREPRWIPMVRREPTDEEKEEYLTQNGEELCYMLDNEQHTRSIKLSELKEVCGL